MVTSVGGANLHFQGLSSDNKPMDVLDGATFHIIDTGEVYVFHDGMWESDKRSVYARESI